MSHPGKTSRFKMSHSKPGIYASRQGVTLFIYHPLRAWCALWVALGQEWTQSPDGGVHRVCQNILCARTLVCFFSSTKKFWRPFPANRDEQKCRNSFYQKNVVLVVFSTENQIHSVFSPSDTQRIFLQIIRTPPHSPLRGHSCAVLFSPNTSRE